MYKKLASVSSVPLIIRLRAASESSIEKPYILRDTPTGTSESGLKIRYCMQTIRLAITRMAVLTAYFDLSVLRRILPKTRMVTSMMAVLIRRRTSIFNSTIISESI